MNILDKLENLLYRLAGVDTGVTDNESGWKHHVILPIAFFAIEALFAYIIQRLQFWPPLNPQAQANVGADSSFNMGLEASHYRLSALS